MLQSINDRIQGWIGWFVVVLISVPFALWGIQSYLGAGADKFVAKVNDVEISNAQFERALSQQRARLQQMFGKNMPNSEAYNELLKKQVLQQLITTEVLNQYANKKGFALSDLSLAGAIRSIDAFKENGQFSQELYERVLNSQGMSLAAFEAIYRQELTTAQLQNAIRSSAFVTQSAVANEEALKNQQRNVSYILFKAADFMKQANITDEKAKQYYTANSSRYMTPEKVSVRYLELKAEDLASEIPVSDADVKKRYDEYVASVKNNEQRKASHILINLAADASADDEKQAREKIDAIKKQLDEGASFAELAKKNSQDEGSASNGGALGLVSKGMMVKPFEDALFALKKGQISNVVRSEFGFHIIKLDDIKTPKIESFASKKAALEKELKESGVQNLFYERAEMLANLAYENPESLDLVAEQLNLKIKTSELFTRTKGEGIAANDKVRTAAFQDSVLKERLNSDAVEISNKQVVVLRLDQHKPAEPETFEQVKAEIVNELKNKEAQRLASEQASSLIKQLEKDDSTTNWSKLSKANDKNAVALNLVKRDDTKADRKIIQTAFKMTKPADNKVSVEQVSIGNGNTAVVAVHSVVDIKAAVDQKATDAAEKRLKDQLAGQEFSAAIEAIKSQFEIYIPEKSKDE